MKIVFLIGNGFDVNINNLNDAIILHEDLIERLQSFFEEGKKYHNIVKKSRR